MPKALALLPEGFNATTDKNDYILYEQYCGLSGLVQEPVSH